MAIADAPHFTDNTQTAVTNPCFIAEILFAFTEGYDKSAKFRLYRSIPTCAEYLFIDLTALFIDQSAYRVEQYIKVEDRHSSLVEHVGPEASLSLQSVFLN